jgi:hypothetical protein
MLRNFGLKVGTAKFEPRVKELVENLPGLTMLVEPLLIVRRVVHFTGMDSATNAHPLFEGVKAGVGTLIAPAL